MNVLVINCGSSSVKYTVFSLDVDTTAVEAEKGVLCKGKIERIGEDTAGKILTHKQALQRVLATVGEHSIDAVGFRVVHGGEKFTNATLIDSAVLDEIELRIPDAPMHNPYALDAIRTVQQEMPGIPHVAVFDTSFHARMPRRAITYAIDHEVATRFGIRRFGFHGISHAYVADRAAQCLGHPLSELRLVTLHLGNGSSACAVEFGRSSETSMGNTPLEGLVMGSRSGDVDAGVLMSLMRSGEFDVDSLDDLLNNRSGLAGLSGVSNDLREIEKEAESGHDRSRMAINVFAHRARKYLGAYAASMGGIDAIVFTGGIGENSSTMRRRILQRLEFLGLYVDEDKNSDARVDSENDHAFISAGNSRVRALVVKTNEELMIARDTLKVAGSLAAEPPKTKTLGGIPIAVSGRHLHLTQETFEKLFGAGASPTKDRDISQPGQYACEERVNLVGPRNRIDGVRLLGPLRSVDQIEISRTDEFRLGVDAPIRDSGQTKDSAPITLEGPAGTVHLEEGLICARRHIHMHTDDATRFGVSDKDEVAVAVRGGPRDLVFGDVLIRVKDSYKLEMHIDTDEGNAAELTKGALGDLVYEDVDAAEAIIQEAL